MRSFLKLAGAILVAGSLQFLNSQTFAEQTSETNLVSAMVKAACAYCEDYTDQVIGVREIRSDWRVGHGYADKDEERISTNEINGYATVSEMSCAYCEDYTDKARAVGEVRTDWRVGVGYAAESVERLAAK